MEDRPFCGGRQLGKTSQRVVVFRFHMKKAYVFYPLATAIFFHALAIYFFMAEWPENRLCRHDMVLSMDLMGSDFLNGSGGAPESKDKVLKKEEGQSPHRESEPRLERASPVKKAAEKTSRNTSFSGKNGTGQKRPGPSAAEGRPGGTKGGGGGRGPGDGGGNATGPSVPFGSVSGPSFRRFIRPVYPTTAKRAGIEGTVKVSLTLEEDGSIAKLEIVESPHPVLSDAAAAAIRKASFKPYKIDGLGKRCNTMLSIRFDLEDR